jgi:anti-sigma regulatory factor (Ser/Thr protein kinase)
VSSDLALRADLPAEPAGVRQARALVRGALHDWGRDDLTDTAVLLVSELATNVVLHARTPYAVVVTRTGSGLRCDVLDDAAAPAAVRDNDVAAATGRGLALVRELADSWGPTPEEARDGFRKGVRFELS